MSDFPKSCFAELLLGFWVFFLDNFKGILQTHFDVPIQKIIEHASLVLFKVTGFYSGQGSKSAQIPKISVIVELGSNVKTRQKLFKNCFSVQVAFFIEPFEEYKAGNYVD